MSVILSPDQLKAVNHTNGALLVVAGPGSGKTRVLTERIGRLLKDEAGHFQVLALTFTNKAANEMRERLRHVPGIEERAFIGTMHSFCTDVLSKHGKAVGINRMPQIFSAFHDRRAILSRAVYNDPELHYQLKLAGERKEQGKRLDGWLRKVIEFKSYLYRSYDIKSGLERKVFEGYQAELRASGAVDFDDLLLLTYQLFEERPKIAGFFRRLYRFICIDEAQDLNGAQYGVLRALCGDEFTNVMMVGDKKQSIYGFNTADPKFMDYFVEDFRAGVIELHENFRSSRAVVQAAKRLDSTYYAKVDCLPVEGAVELIAANDESDEAEKVLGRIKHLSQNPHPDVEKPIDLASCAVLGRTRYTLLAVEEKLREWNWPYYKQLKADHENESGLAKEFELGLRLLVNPKDKLHFDMLKKKWRIDADLQHIPGNGTASGIETVKCLASQTKDKNAGVILEAVTMLPGENGMVRMAKALDRLEQYGCGHRDKIEKRAVLEDIKVLRGEWERFLRVERASKNDLGSFLTHKALGTMQQPKQEGLALLTVHSSKGLEFDVVFVIGMSEGTFPDYRALKKKKSLEEEHRNAFVAVTRSKRLLYLSYPNSKLMPWGESSEQKPSRFLEKMGVFARGETRAGIKIALL